MNKKAVLFDMDGTLIDTFTQMEKENKVKKKSLSEKYFDYKMRHLKSYSFSEMERMIKNDFLMKHKSEQILQNVIEIMKHRYEHAVVKPGAIKFLSYLKEKGYKICLCTNNASSVADYILDIKELKQYFDFVITSHDVKEPKPDPEMYLTAYEKIGVKKEECIIFEDMLEGVTAGNKAGIDVCCVYDKFNHKDLESLKKHSVYMIDNYEDLWLYENL